MTEKTEKEGSVEERDDYIISVENLTHRYGDLVAVDNISFKVRRGEIFSFLGPNGAGKTTTINVLTTLLPIQQGSVFIDGLNLRTEKRKIKKNNRSGFSGRDPRPRSYRIRNPVIPRQNLFYSEVRARKDNFRNAGAGGA